MSPFPFQCFSLPVVLIQVNLGSICWNKISRTEQTFFLAKSNLVFSFLGVISDLYFVVKSLSTYFYMYWWCLLTVDLSSDTASSSGVFLTWLDVVKSFCNHLWFGCLLQAFQECARLLIWSFPKVFVCLIDLFCFGLVCLFVSSLMICTDISLNLILTI